MHRREVLRAVTTAGALLGVGCVGDSPGGADETPPPTNQDTVRETATPTETEATVVTPAPTATSTPTPRSGTVAVDVGPGTFFRPASLRVVTGTTVRWVWQSDNHNVAVREQPVDADWDGHRTIENTGFEFEFEFEVPGTYSYFCEPHVREGMTGSVIVSPAVSND